MATENPKTIVGFYQTPAQAENAIDELKGAGFRSDQLGLAIYSEDATGNKSESFWRRVVPFLGHRIEHEYNGDQMRISLESEGISVDKARYFEHRLAHGNGAILSVKADGRQNMAEQIVERTDGDLGREASSFQYPAPAVPPAATPRVGPETAPPTSPLGAPTRHTTAPVDSGTTSPKSPFDTEAAAKSPAATTPISTEKRKIQLLGEVLRIHKENVPLSEVKLHKEVVTDTQKVEVPVSHEEVVIERHPVSGESATPRSEIGKEKDIRVPVNEERVKVEKRPTVREEVEVGTKNVEETRNVTEDVRREELRVERDEKAKVTEKTDETTNVTGTPPPPKVKKRGA